MASPTILFRARIPKARFKRVEKILSRIGFKPGEAFNILLAEIELREGLPFQVTARSEQVLTADQQADAWKDALGAY